MVQDNSITSPTLSDCHVLVVEDEPLILMMFQDEVQSFGCASVIGVGDSASALAVLAHQHVDLAILDIHLVGTTTSFDVAAQLRRGGIPFVFATGSQGDEVPEQFRDVAFISKPFIAGQLRVALHAALRGSGRR